jgi:hypothetical protein
MTDSATCVEEKALETAYNSVSEVLPFTGILFSVDASADLRITGLSMDVRTDLMDSTQAESPRVECYYRRGPFSETDGVGATWLSNATYWTRAFKGRADADASKGGIRLPASNFTAIDAASGDRISFYITMRGSYIDSTVNALMKTGEALLVGDHMSISVGAALSDENFPPMINRTVDPGFAGVIQYEIASPCSTASPVSSGGFNNAADDAVNNGESQESGASGSQGGGTDHGPLPHNLTTTEIIFPTIFSNETKIDINSIVESTIKSYVSSHSIFDQYKTSASFALVGSSSTVKGSLYVGPCPVEFNTCPPVVYKTTFSVQHDQSCLSSSQLLYDVFSSSQDVLSALSQAQYKDDSDIQVDYAGPVPAELTFQLELLNQVGDDDVLYNENAVPTLSKTQLEFLDGSAEEHLDLHVKSTLANHFLVQELAKNGAGNQKSLRRQRSLNSGNTIQVTGTLKALYESDRIQSAMEYEKIIVEAFKGQGERDFVSLLRDGSDENVTGFESLQSVSFVINGDTANPPTTGGSSQPTTNPTGTSSMFSTILMIVFISVASAVTAMVLCYLRKRFFCRSAQPKPIAEESAPELRRVSTQSERFDREASITQRSNPSWSNSLRESDFERQAPSRNNSGDRLDRPMPRYKEEGPRRGVSRSASDPIGPQGTSRDRRPPGRSRSYDEPSSYRQSPPVTESNRNGLPFCPDLSNERPPLQRSHSNESMSRRTSPENPVARTYGYEREPPRRGVPRSMSDPIGPRSNSLERGQPYEKRPNNQETGPHPARHPFPPARSAEPRRGVRPPPQERGVQRSRSDDGTYGASHSNPGRGARFPEPQKSPVRGVNRAKSMNDDRRSQVPTPRPRADPNCRDPPISGKRNDSCVPQRGSSTAPPARGVQRSRSCDGLEHPTRSSPPAWQNAGTRSSPSAAPESRGVKRVKSLNIGGIPAQVECHPTKGESPIHDGTADRGSGEP